VVWRQQPFIVVGIAAAFRSHIFSSDIHTSFFPPR
jgi:hypothetical protein